MAPRAKSLEDRVRRSVKKVTHTLPAVEALMSSEGKLDVIATARGLTGRIRIVVRIRSTIPECWAMAVLLNNQRIDGIDWESRVNDHRGRKHDCKGWHRHMWTAKTTDTLKECLPKFAPRTPQEFLMNGFRLLNVQLKRGQDGERLPFDQERSG